MEERSLDRMTQEQSIMNVKQIENLLADLGVDVLDEAWENYSDVPRKLMTNSHVRGYFTARKVQHEIAKALKNQELPETMRKAPLDFYVRKLLGELEGEHQNKMAFEKKENKWAWSAGKFLLDNQLSRLLDFCRGIFDKEQLGYTVWNLLTIWREHRGELSGINLQELDLGVLSLNNIRLSRPGIVSNLSGSRLSEKNLFFQGHKASIESANFSGDGLRIVTGDREGFVKIWEINTGRCSLTFDSHEEFLEEVYFSQNDRYIITLTDNRPDPNITKIWDAETGQHLKTIEEQSDTDWEKIYSPDRQLFVTGLREGTVKVWDTETGICLATLLGHSEEVIQIEFSPDTQRIFTKSMDRTVRVWDAKTGKNLLYFQTKWGKVSATDFSPDGTRIATGAKNYTIKVWDTENGHCHSTLEGHSKQVVLSKFSPDGQKLLTTSKDNSARVWDITTGRCLLTLENFQYAFDSAQFSPDNVYLLICSVYSGATVWNIELGQPILTIPVVLSGIRSTSLSPDGQLIATGSKDGTAKIWNSNTGRCLSVIRGHDSPVWFAAFISDGRMLLTGSDNTINLWNVDNGQYLSTFEDQSKLIQKVGLNHGGYYAVTGLESETVCIWDAQKKECIARFKEFPCEIHQISLSSDGRQIATSLHYSNNAQIWDIDHLDAPRLLEGHTGSVFSTAISPDGRFVATGSSDHTAKVWDIETGKCLTTLKGHTSSIFCLAFSPDNQLIATGSDDQRVKLWEVASGACMMTFEGHTDEVLYVCFSPNGQFICSITEYCSARIWDTETGHCLLSFTDISFGNWSTSFSPDSRKVIAGTPENLAKLWDIRSGRERWCSPDLPGLLIQGCLFYGLHPESNLSKEDIATLSQYGALLGEDEDVLSQKSRRVRK